MSITPGTPDDLTEHKPKPEAMRMFGINIIRCVHCGRPLQVGQSDWEHIPGTPERSSR